MVIQKVAVLGSGVMGAQIAGLLAGLGFEVLLLDILPPKGPTVDEEQRGVRKNLPAWRNQLAIKAVERLKALKPPPLFRPADFAKIAVGNLEDDLKQAAQCDWVIEVVVERLEIKQALYARLDDLLAPHTILTSNTSGLSTQLLTMGRSSSFKRRFMVTHFFNPPRYLKLLELVPGPDTDPDLLRSMVAFMEDALGKGVVFAKDTPNFIANRIGVYHFLDVMHLTEENGWPIEAVDGVLGPATAHPKSAIFRTGDVVGLDTLGFVAETVIKGCPNDPGARRMRIPQYIVQMITKGWTGQKAGQGFYRKDKATGAITVLDPATLDYRPQIKFRTPSLGDVRSIEDPAERLRRTVWAEDQAGEIAWPAISHLIVYAASLIPDIADDIVQIDRALRWGFNMELGPFEMWDALGVEKVVTKLESEKINIPPVVRQLLDAKRMHFYEWRTSHRHYFDLKTREYQIIPGSEKNISLKRLAEVGRRIEENAGASLLDLGDGVLCCEFHTKMNAIDADVIEILGRSLDRVEKEGVGLLVANDGAHFSAGANLLLILMTAKQGDWQQLDGVIRRFQAVVQRMRFSPKPVMSVPFGMAIGGGCEIALAAGRRHAAVETYIGLVEVGAGVIPAGGGCKNFLLHFEDEGKRKHLPKDKIWFSPDDGGPFPKVAKAFELIGTARVSGSALEAKNLGILRPDDRISLDREKLTFEAKAHLLEWAKTYVPPKPRDDISLPGLGGKMALLNALRDWQKLGKATEYDVVVAEKLAHVLAGGDRPNIHTTSEEHILDLEREAFLSLCGDERTHARMAALLETGKPLRN